MPYKIVERDGKFCVYKHDEDGNAVGESHGCHDSREQANGQMRALYAAENDKKETDDADEALSLLERLKALFTREKPGKTVDGEKYPASDFLVADGSPSEWHLQVKRHGTPDHGLMGAAKAALTSPGGHRGNKYEGPNKTEAIARLKRLYAAEGMPWGDEKKENAFMVWKEASGAHRWLAVYSSKFRDDDHPPEILAEAAHKEFVAACDRGEWPLPELWLWHVKGTSSGRADFVAYDDSGFALAGGRFDPTTEAVAERLATYEGDLLTSHGMPVKEIERSADDPTVITRYRTREISPLPAWAAANKNTGFYLLKEVDDMALPEEKRRFLADILGEEKAAQVEAQLDAKGKALADEGVEFKEAPPAEEAAPVAEPEPEPAPVEAAPAPDYPTRGEVAAAVADSLKPTLGQLSDLAAAVEGLGKELKEARATDDERFKAMAQATPAASLFAQIQSAIGSPDARIDGREALAKAGPKGGDTDAGEGPALVPLINAFMDASWKRGA
jgi:hypothetical protein